MTTRASMTALNRRLKPTGVKVCANCAAQKRLTHDDWYSVTRNRLDRSGKPYVEWDSLCKPCRRLVNVVLARRSRRTLRVKIVRAA